MDYRFTEYQFTLTVAGSVDPGNSSPGDAGTAAERALFRAGIAARSLRTAHYLFSIGFSTGISVSAMISAPLGVGWMPSAWMVPGTWMRFLYNSGTRGT